MKLEYWKILLTEWRNCGRDGFTIPFILGSQQYLPETHEKQDLKALFLDIIRNNGVPIYIKYCLTTEDIVLEIKDERKNLPGYFPTFNGLDQSNLFLTSLTVLNDLGIDCETIIETLADKYQPYIDKKEFSKNDRQRGNYSSDEIIFIKKSFTKYLLD
jgi:hypothetical protein